MNWLNVDFRCRVILTCVKFTFANKIEAMKDKSLVSVKDEPRSTSHLSSALFLLPLFYLHDLNLRALTCIAKNASSREESHDNKGIFILFLNTKKTRVIFLFYSSVYVFITKVLIEETIFTSSTGDRGPPVLNAVIWLVRRSSWLQGNFF